MYDIKPLEEKWERYNQKKKKPWYLLGLGIFSILVLILLFTTSKKTVNKMEKKIEIAEHTNRYSTLLNRSFSKLEVKELEKQIPLSRNVNTIISSNNPIEIKIKKPVIKKKIRKKVHLNIIETTSPSAYQDVANRFYDSHDTDDSLFLAKSYYSKGNYEKSEYWALETNKVNDSIEESWLIFANSKAKQKNKNEAIRILNNYIKRSNSKKAKKLLLDIKKGI